MFHFPLTFIPASFLSFFLCLSNGLGYGLISSWLLGLWAVTEHILVTLDVTVDVEVCVWFSDFCVLSLGCFVYEDK
jgi:hypothetical protein